MVRTRFAPSPTGYMHIGNLRTALYAYLFAKKHGGRFLLRIEDTDRERFVADGTKKILETLDWIGLNPDEGVVLGDNSSVSQKGEFGSYIQSERLDIYHKYCDQLIDQGDAYHCFCSSERLEDLRKMQQLNKLPTGYDGHCRDLDPAESKKRAQSGEKHVVRMKMPKTGEAVFTDLIRGEICVKNELVDDQVIMKTDGFPTYHLAVVVDDHHMQITHVIRGEEWISSTPKHLQLYRFFGWTAPAFAHLALLLNSDKSKLSKRQSDVSVADYVQKGYLPEAIINFMVLLGWNPGDNRELFSLDDLIKEFSLEKVGKSGAVFNLEKLDWYNKEYIKSIPIDRLIKYARPFFDKNNLIVSDELLTKALPLEKERVTTLAEFPEALGFVFALPDYASEILVWKKSSIEAVKEILPKLNDFLNTFSVQDWNKLSLETKVGEWIKENNYSNGPVLWPLRVALSGQDKSPGPFEIAEVLGKDESLRRLEIALTKLI
ncbi:MAG: glutamate--tRNA ligase [Candidatus Magasanikbacteria bacterium]